MSRTPVIELHCGEYSASVAPAAGGRLASLAWSCGSIRCPLLVEWSGDSFASHEHPKAGAFPMLPFANRLAPEGFEFGGRVIRPTPGPAGFAQHGFAHREAWDVLLASSERVVMRYSHDGRDAGWPWAWSATQEVRLDQSGATVQIRVCNESPEPMPLVMGWHPYHPTAANIVPDDLSIEPAIWHTLDRHGAVGQPSGADAFSMRRGETAALASWAGRARLQVPRGIIRVRSQGADHLVVHRPANGDYLCVEPVTGLPGQLARAVPLQAGETRQLVWCCHLESLSSIE